MNLTALQHSVFLQALGSAIINSLWQTFILWLLYETISVSYKNASAKFKNNLSTILLFFSFILFLSGFVSKIINHQQAISINAAASNTEEFTTVHATSAYQQFLSYASSSIPYLSVAYIFLLFILMAKLFAAYRYVYIISNKRLINPPGEMTAFANKVSGQMKITRKIRVWISHHIDVPATIGCIKPVILIPFASLNNLSADQLEAIILHELSHIKRNDYITNIIIAVIETILFFNPFVVLLSKVIKRERENCCDDFVLQYQYDPHSYASALLRLEQSRSINLKLAIGAVSGKKQLLSRIKRITGRQVVSRQFNYGQKLLTLLLVTAIICSLAWLSPGEKKPISNNIFGGNYEGKILPKTNISPKDILPDASRENLEIRIVKRNSTKKDLTSIKEQDVPDFAFEENNKFNINVDIPAANNEGSPLAMNLKDPPFFFNESKIKLPQSINIENFPFQDTNFKIDLSKIDISQLNENLKQAYKEINNINWNEVQNNIRESFSQINASNLPIKEQARLFVEKANEFSKFKKDKEKLDKVYLIRKFNKEIKLQDSLQSTIMKLVYDNNERIQREYEKVQNQYAEGLRNNSHFTYNSTQKSEKNTNNDPFVSIGGNNKLPATAESKTIKIVIKHSPKPVNGLHPKKFLQFSLDSDTRKPTHRNVINVELTDLP